MNLDEGKLRFINSWGQLAVNWGANKTMGQVHALLLISPEPICADEIMEQLSISRGNANMTTRNLMNWGLVHKRHIQGERKDYFVAEKDVNTIFRKVIEQRRKKELDPMLRVLGEISAVEGGCDESNEFCKVVKELQSFSTKADGMLENLAKLESSWLLGSAMRLMR